MAKMKEIKYNILRKTADARGVMYFTQNGVNYIGNAYMIVYGMNNDEFDKAIEKTKAIENYIIGEQANIIVSDIKSYEVEGEYTRVCYEINEGIICFFKADNKEFIPIQYSLFEIVKELPVNKVWCYSNRAGIVIELTDGRGIVIMPYVISKEENKRIGKKLIDIGLMM